MYYPDSPKRFIQNITLSGALNLRSDCEYVFNQKPDRIGTEIVMRLSYWNLFFLPFSFSPCSSVALDKAAPDSFTA